MIKLSGQGWSAEVSSATALGLSVRSQWDDEEVERLPTRQLVQLCQDKHAWCRDLMRSPAPPDRVDLSEIEGFKEVVFLSESTFLIVPVRGLTKTVASQPRSGDLKGVGELTNEQYQTLKRATYLGLAKLVLTPPTEEETAGSGDGSKKPHWTRGHWMKVQKGHTAHNSSPWGESRSSLKPAQTWVRQYHTGDI